VTVKDALKTLCDICMKSRCAECPFKRGECSCMLQYIGIQPDLISRESDDELTLISETIKAALTART
jgi:hypothetical protein